MIRRPRNYQPYLLQQWQFDHPERPQKKEFNEEIVTAVNFIMRQIDPAGKLPMIMPPMPAEDYVPQRSVRRRFPRPGKQSSFLG